MNRVNYLIAFKDMEAKQYNPSNTLISTILVNQVSANVDNDLHDNQHKDRSSSDVGSSNPVFNVIK